ncbi:hypothetical protein ACH5RR_006017 [Cinchona calisaya]|uniref:Uncharacterized protein n=1 Tax=Cinchona calisaya TaxID=153742 RepID=A0ABD3AMU0_9GENT
MFLIFISKTVLCWRVSPAARRRQGTLADANWPVPCASPWSKIVDSGNEWCTTPVNLNKATSGCPVISIPKGSVYPHSLLIWLGNTLPLIVPENSEWNTINIPTESKKECK